jgi:hypothetical protein
LATSTLPLVQSIGELYNGGNREPYCSDSSILIC